MRHLCAKSVILYQMCGLSALYLKNNNHTTHLTTANNNHPTHLTTANNNHTTHLTTAHSFVGFFHQQSCFIISTIGIHSRNILAASPPVSISLPVSVLFRLPGLKAQCSWSLLLLSLFPSGLLHCTISCLERPTLKIG